jgi:hypothetical protein
MYFHFCRLFFRISRYTIGIPANTITNRRMKRSVPASLTTTDAARVLSEKRKIRMIMKRCKRVSDMNIILGYRG